MQYMVIQYTPLNFAKVYCKLTQTNATCMYETGRHQGSFSARLRWTMSKESLGT